MKLERTHYYICFYSLFILFCGVQPSYSRLLRDSEKEEFSIMHPRILETTHVSCEADCISNVGNSEEHVAIVIGLSSKANYTLKFTIPDNGENFNLGIKSNNIVQASVFMEQLNSTKLVAFDQNWIQGENGWMKIYVYGDTLRLYQGGKAILQLFNPSDNVETLTVEFHHNGLSTVVNIFLLIAVIVTCIIWLPIGQFLVAVVRTVVAKSKELCFGIKGQEGQGTEPRLLDTVMANRYSSQQTTGKPEDGQQVAGGRQMVEEDRYQDEKGKHHQLKDEEEVYDLQAAQARKKRENRDNHEVAVPVPNKTQTAARKINLTVDNIKYCFPEAKYEDIKSKIPQPVCFLCFDQLTPGMYCRQLYCQHIFHAECIELWLQKQLLKKPDRAYCPNCKADMMTYESYKGKEQVHPIGDTLNL